MTRREFFHHVMKLHFDQMINKIIPMIDCKNYLPATAQNPEIFGELI